MRIEITEKGVFDQDGKPIPVGSILNIGSEIPRRLVGKCKPSGESVGKTFIVNPGKEKTVSEIIRTLTPKDYTADGKPEVAAINMLMPEGMDPVTAKERDAIFAEMNRL